MSRESKQPIEGFTLDEPEQANGPLPRVCIRLYLDGKLQSEEVLEGSDEEISRKIEDNALKNAKLATGRSEQANLIEIEFLDEPDPLLRFARFGSDKSRMQNPVRIYP